jgi:hypothetical protein
MKLLKIGSRFAWILPAFSTALGEDDDTSRRTLIEMQNRVFFHVAFARVDQSYSLLGLLADFLQRAVK